MKLAEIRAKTDRDLGILVRREVERALVLAGRANYGAAERGLATAKTLLAVSGLPEMERATLESRLHDLRSVLERTEQAVA